MPASETRVPIADGDIFCRSAGARESMRPALLLLHGWTLDSRMWAAQLDAFAAERLVIAPDRRGFGQSSAPADPRREADDLIALLDYFGADAAIIVGMSQSGRIALEFARRHPQRLAALVLQSARFGGNRSEILLDDYAALVRAGQLDEMKRRWRAHPMMQAATDAAQHAADAMLESYDGRDLIAGAPALADLGVPDLATITAPMLIVTGEHDTAQRHASAVALAQALPESQSAQIRDAGHLCNFCRPSAYNAALSEFLQRNGL